MKVKILAQAIAAIGLLGSGFAHAADDAGNQLERVTITGSNIKRINKEGALPVEVLKKEDIEKTGASTTVQLLESLTSTNDILAGTNASSFAAGAASAGLRGMGAKYVLVLLNGRRLPNYAMPISGTDTFVDLNTLPISMIDSVEILRDGASAIYGSDAVAGVINFKTKRNYQGTQISTRYGQTEDGDGMEQSAGVMSGIGDKAKDGYNLIWEFNAYHREPVFYSKHEPVNTMDYRRYGGKDTRSGTRWGLWKDYTNSKFYSPMPGCTKSTVTLPNGNTICPSDYADLGTQLSPRTSRYGLNVNFSKTLGGDAELYAELSANRNLTSLDGGWSFMNAQLIKNGYASYPTSPATIAALQSIYPNFVNGDTLQVTRSLYEPGKSMRDVTADTYRAVVGINSTYKDWDLDGYINLGQSKASVNTSNVVLNTPFQNMLQNGPATGQPRFDPFAQNNPVASLSPYFTSITNQATSNLEMLELKASKSELATLPAGPLGFATGLQWWHESIDSKPDGLIQQNAIMNFAQQQPLQASRSVAALYAELNVPVIKNLETQLAVRADHYNDFGDTVNPKVAFSYRPWQQVMLRGSATSSFKAPSLPQLYTTRTAYQSVYDYAQCASKGIPDKCTKASQQIQSGGNPGLKAETNKNFGFGIVLEPIKNLTASIDWYKLDQKDTIQSLDPQYVLNNASQFPGYIVRKPSGIAGVLGDIDYVKAPYINSGKTVTSGLDIDIQYELSLGSYGKLNFREQQSRILSFQNTQQASAPLQENVDYASMPRWKNLFTVDYRFDKYSATVVTRTYAGYKNLYSPDYTNTSAAIPQRVPSYTAFDVNMSVRPIKKLKIDGGIRNIGNRTPPYATGAGVETFSGPSTDLWGRTYYVSAEYKF
ncbi:TonB-dependent receptor [Chromobacterium amazonense]|uniref:TonB-dependent receptor n=1 Tax=Chromobacterium amazonense TaxID=1382803 RepID=UPI003F7A2F1C